MKGRPVADAAAMPPALVLGFAEPSSLGVIRGLGRRGIPHVDVGARVGGRGSFVAYSRWHHAWSDPRGKEPTPSSLPQFLAGLPFERMVLIPCTDQWVAAVAGLDPSLTARFPASVAPPETIQVLLDKGRFAEATGRLGVPHPRTVCLNPQDDPATLPDAAFHDAFLKPRNSKAFLERYGVKATRFTTRAEAIAFMLEARRAGLELMLQEYIPGPASCHYFLNGFIDHRGEVCACLACRRLRMPPGEFVDGSFGVSIPLEEMREAVQAVKHLLGALRYRGVFNAEFKYDERDGRFKILEVNVRPWSDVGFTIACGVDVVEMAYRDALGLPVQPVKEYKVGRRYLDPSPDVDAGRRMLREGRLTLWTWLRSWPGATQMIFSWDDPVPALVCYLNGARRRLRGATTARTPSAAAPPAT